MVALWLAILMVLPTLWLGMRSYGSYRLLRSAYEAGAPATSSIRAWMTLGYVAVTYGTPEQALRERLQVPPGTDSGTSLKVLADKAGLSPPEYVRRAQLAIAELSKSSGVDQNGRSSGWLAAISDQVLTALLVYGYPVLALTLLLGAIGLPLPDGLAMTVVGSLATSGRMDIVWAGIIAVVASVLGDVVGYGIGRVLGREVLERRGRWLGLTALRRIRVEALFERWGALTVFITRTFASYLSSVASLLAGMSHYPLGKYLPITAMGRVAWTIAYLGLGYAIGTDLEAASGFLANLSGFLLSALVLAVFASLAIRVGGKRP
jgi:membrane protein DedA with SNARE-associated domain